MNIRELLGSIFSRVDEMSRSQSQVIDNMEGFCFQIAVHITKICNSSNLTANLRNKWIRDIAKHCNLLHKEHLNNGKHSINFDKRGNIERLIDHSVAKINSEIDDVSQINTDREKEYTDFIREALKFSQQHYNQFNPFTADWVSQELIKIGK